MDLSKLNETRENEEKLRSSEPDSTLWQSVDHPMTTPFQVLEEAE